MTRVSHLKKYHLLLLTFSHLTILIKKPMLITILLLALAVLLFAICFKSVEFFEKI